MRQSDSPFHGISTLAFAAGLALLLATIPALSEPESTSTVNLAAETGSPESSKWKAQGEMEIFTMAATGAPYFGSSLSYRFSTKDEGGLKPLLSLAVPETNMFGVFYRRSLSERAFGVFLETGLDWFTSQSLGYSAHAFQVTIGTQILIGSHWLVSPSVGAEGADRFLPFLGSSSASSNLFSPKLSIAGGYRF